MTHKDEGHYGMKHNKDKKPEEKIIKAIKKNTLDGKITCNDANKIAQKLNVSPSEVGFSIDLLELKICKCLNGLFGHCPEKKLIKPVKNISPELKKTLNKTASDSKIECIQIWKIADNFSAGKVSVSSTCDTLNIKITKCQLGAF